MSTRLHDPVRERIVWLVDHFHGNRGVNRAAQHIGIPQSTLQRIYAGERKPSVDVLRSIAEAYPCTGLTLDWLISGRGADPQLIVGDQIITDPESAGAFFRWWSLLRRVGIETESDVANALLFALRTFPSWLAIS